MNKTEIIADITAKALKVVKIVEEADAVKNAAGVKQYLANVMEQNGSVVSGRNIAFYTIDEGVAGEKAFYRDTIVQKSVARELVVAYMVSKSPIPFLRYTIDNVDEADKSARVSVVKDNGDGTATEKRILVYKNGASPIAHVELT